MNEDRTELARQVHYAFLPRQYEDEDLLVSVRAVPHSGLGGDYCGIVALPEGRVALTMCDATGHDMASALFAARINTYVLSRLPRNPRPGELVESLNDFLTKRMGGTLMQATFCAAVFDPVSGGLEFAGAGHPPALHYKQATAEVERLASQTTMVGAFSTLRVPASSTRTSFDPGDRLLLFTDGLIDAHDAAGEAFGLERLEQLLREHATLELDAFNDQVVAAVRTHAGGALEDDALLLSAVRRARS